MIASQPYPDGYYLMLGLFAIALVGMFVGALAVFRKWKTEEVMEERDEAVALLFELVDPSPCRWIAGVCFAHSHGSVFDGCPDQKAQQFLGLTPVKTLPPYKPTIFTKEKTDG